MINRTDFQIHALQTSERALHIRQSFIAAHHFFTAQSLQRNTGADDIDAIQRRLSFDIVLFALAAKSVVLDEQAEVLAHFVAAQNPPHRQANLLAATQRFFLRWVAATILSNCFWVASNNSFRLRLRSTASSGLRQAINRSSG